jgi:hypothetical protein
MSKPRGMLSFLYHVYFDAQDQATFSDGKLADRVAIMKQFGLREPGQQLVTETGADKTKVPQLLQDTVRRQLKRNFNNTLKPYGEGGNNNG